MVATQYGDVYVWKYQGDPPYRVQQIDPEPASLSTSSARQSPSRLLAAQHQVVDLVGRSQELAGLTDWAGGPERVAVRVVHGVGGQGKTRLAFSFTRDMAAKGWAVMNATHRLHGMLGSGSKATTVKASGTDLLLVIDYADRWTVADLQAVLDAHLGLGNRLRVLMLARAVRGWWSTPRQALRNYGVELVDEVRLRPFADGLAGEGSETKSAYLAAASAFARRLGVRDLSGLAVPANISELGQHTLTLHMAALVGVDASARGIDPPASPAALSAYLLHRERQGWNELR